MRVDEIAKELDVSAESLVQLLREMDIPVRSHMSQLSDGQIARLRTVMERERRLGHASSGRAIEAAIEDNQGAGRRRRRRKADETTSPVADAAEAMAAEAAEAAAERGAEVVTTGTEPEGVVIVEPAPAPVEAVVEPAEERPRPVAPVPPAEGKAPPAAPLRPAAAAPPPAAGERITPARRVPQQPSFTPPPPRREERPAARQDAPPPSRQGAPPPARSGQGAPPTRQPRQGGFAPTPVRHGAAPAPPARPAPAAAGGKGRVEGTGDASADARKRKKKDRKKKRGVDQEAVDQMFRKTMAAMEGGGRRRRKGRDSGPTAQERREEERERQRQEEATTVRVNEFLTVAELAEMIDRSPTEIVASAFKNLSLVVTINQRLDFDQIEMVLDEFGFTAIREEEYGADVDIDEEEDEEKDLVSRPPVVTVMGHVDHGKTSLLDHIRKTNVIAGESGGITQHIGAYNVDLEGDRSISFLDTPGHAAFTAMRARGAEVTDLVILVVAADDSVMPQTVEAISHARNAGVPLVVAVNKVDLPDANPLRVKQDLLQHGVVLEEFGGDVMSAEVSAKRGTGVDDLLEKVLLQADILELKANPNRNATGVVIESRLDPGKGPIATVLVTNGTLRTGDSFVVGRYDGRVRAMLDERGNSVPFAGPAMPVQILGISGTPAAGDQLLVLEAARAAEIAQTRQRLEREKQMRIKGRARGLIDWARMVEKGEETQLNLVIKGDVDGSVQALSDSLEQLSTPEVRVQVIHRGVGAINESDAMLASTSGAIVIGFHVRPTSEARAVAEREGIDIRLYNIIYEAVSEVRLAMEGMLSPEEREVLLGSAQVRQIFKVPRVGTVAGCMVTDGEIQRRGKIRVVRDGIQIYEGELESLKRFKDDVREVRAGFDCGLNIGNFNDVKVGDVIECYRVEEVARTLSRVAE